MLAVIWEFLRLMQIYRFCDEEDGCLRRSYTEEREDEREMVEHSTVTPHHRLECFPEESLKTSCLNGGQCFAIRTYNDFRETYCKCGAEWEGTRCEQAYIDQDILAIQERNIRTAHMAAGVSASILVFFIILVTVYVYIKYKRKLNCPRRQGSTQSHPPDSTESPPFLESGMLDKSMCHQTNNDFSPLIKQSDVRKNEPLSGKTSVK